MKMGNFQDLLEKHLTKEELEEVDREVALEAEALRTMQQNIKDALDNYMKIHKIGFNEAVARLGSTPRQISQIQKGVANLRLSTLAHISAMLGQTPMIMFKKK
jgi:sialic acid synthase SpsE